MKKSKDLKYIEITEQSKLPALPADASAEDLVNAYRVQFEGGEKADISYSLENIVAELSEPRVLLVDFGDHAVNTVRALRDVGLEVCVPYTSDMVQDPYIRVAHRGICIGESFNEFIFKNSYAILKAAEEYRAKAILFIDPSLSGDDSFLAIAAERGIEIFRAVDANVPYSGWIICNTTTTPASGNAWKKCTQCNLLFDEQSLALNHYVCPACGKYSRMSSLERINDLVDAHSFEEWCKGLPDSDPLEFPEYQQKLHALRESTGLQEAVRCGEGSVAGVKTAICAMDSAFMMGSMGQVVGEKITRCVERATQENLPLIIFSASGGARMQEGLISLMQMAKVSGAIAQHAEKGLLYISVLTDPTTGGVTASFAMQGDVIIAEPGILIGFAGQRVIRDTIKRELPEGFQTAEFALDHGLIDAIVTRKALRRQLAHILAIHKASSNEDHFINGDTITYSKTEDNLLHGYFTTNLVNYGMGPQIKKVILSNLKESKAPFYEVFKLPSFFKKTETVVETHQDALLSDLSDEAAALLDDTVSRLDSAQKSHAWESVGIVRNTKRPTAQYYIDKIFDSFIELHGDRAFADDGAVIGGIAWLDERPVTIIGLEKGVDLKERLKRNFGCPQPEGYRKSLRLMRQAEKFNRPVICLVDTQGAFCGTEAEERGQGNAIAENLMALATLKVPVISILIGEGGSGGALALALADRVAMQQYAVYSVLSPEGFASILWKDGSRAPEAASVMKMTANEVCEMGIVDEVLSEGIAPAHENPEAAATHIQSYLNKTLREIAAYPIEELCAKRYERFRKF